jgi:hypothetical protein
MIVSDYDWLVEQGFDPDAASDLTLALGRLQNNGLHLLVQPSDAGTWYLMRPVWEDDPSPELVNKDGLVPLIEGSEQHIAGFAAGVFWAMMNKTTDTYDLSWPIGS